MRTIIDNEYSGLLFKMLCEAIEKQKVILDKENEIKALKNELSYLKGEVLRYSGEIESIKNSESLKLGMAITSVPRRIKKIFKK